MKLEITSFMPKKKLSLALLLVKHLAECMEHADEILYFQNASGRSFKEHYRQQ